MPFGRRKLKDIKFDLRPVFEQNDILYIEKKAIKVEPSEDAVYLEEGEVLPYDYLVVATGVSLNFDVIDGLKPEDHKIQNIVIPKLALKTQEAFEKEVFGAPTFIVNDKIFWGQDRLEYALDEFKIN